MIVNNALSARAVDVAGEDGPFVTVSLLKCRARAQYPDGSGEDVSGLEAYGRYVAGVGDCLRAVGARLAYFGDVKGVSVGEVEELWDLAAVVEYPSNAAVRTLMSMPEYQAIIPHRVAGLAGQLSLRTAPRVVRGS